MALIFLASTANGGLEHFRIVGVASVAVPGSRRGTDARALRWAGGHFAEYAPALLAAASFSLSRNTPALTGSLRALHDSLSRCSTNITNLCRHAPVRLDRLIDITACDALPRSSWRVRAQRNTEQNPRFDRQAGKRQRPVYSCEAARHRPVPGSLVTPNSARGSARKYLSTVCE